MRIFKTPARVVINPSYNNTFFCRDPLRFVTLLIQIDVSSALFGANSHEFGVAGAAGFPEVASFLGAFLIEVLGLVKSSGLVVESADAGQRRQYRGLVLAVPRSPPAARHRQRARHRADAAAWRGLCVRLRLPLDPAARRCAADLSVRHLAVERCGRTLRGHRG